MRILYLLGSGLLMLGAGMLGGIWAAVAASGLCVLLGLLGEEK